MPKTSRSTILRTRISRWHSARLDRLRLERELATYRTPAEQRELTAMLERHTDDEIASLERSLSRLPFSAAIARTSVTPRTSASWR